MKDCTCKDWKANIKEINGVLDSARIHGIFLSNKYIYFRYCPWCGKKGTVEQKLTDKGNNYD